MCDFEIKLELDTSIESVKQRMDEAIGRKRAKNRENKSTQTHLYNSGNDQAIQRVKWNGSDKEKSSAAAT